MTTAKDPSPRPVTELKAAEFRPLESALGKRKFFVSPGYLVLGVLGIAALLVLVFLFTARAVIFRLDPATAELEVSGIAFNIGDNFLLLPGEHRVAAAAAGYYPLDAPITVTREKTQEIRLALEPLPGRLDIRSTLQDIQVSIDGEPAGVAPGIIEDVSRGPRKVGFSKHRYFPGEQEVEVEGLGRTQTVTVELDPAWGQMQFTSVPAGADLYIDDQLIGQTPLSTEVLETGSRLRLSAPGYKTWERDVSVKAGTTDSYPTVELTVADGTLRIASSPAGAGITINREFRGTAPMTVALSPLREHTVELYLEGYRKATRRVGIEPEQEAALNVDLAPIIGRIRLAVQPGDAEVVVDGRVRGRGSQTLDLNARKHEITVRQEGYEAQTLSVTPRPDLEQSLDIRLLTVQQAYWATRPPRISSPVGSQLKLFRTDSTFRLGAPRREPGRRANEAERDVRLVRPFYMGTHEVTNGEFRQWKDNHSSRAIKGQTLDMDTQPVSGVSWQDAALFCNWLSRRAGLPVFYIVAGGVITGFDVDSHGYRLPTEAEWAWAAKVDGNGNTLVFPWGTDAYPPVSPVENYADASAAKFLSFTLSNYDDGFPVAAPIGSFPANARGLFDLGGNVAEWTHDFYEIRQYRGAPEVDPVGPETGGRHTIRGASWALGSRSELRLSYRDAGSDGRMDVGFRLARYVDKAGIEP